MRKTICSSLLVLALCGSAFAGDINSPPVAAPLVIAYQPSAPRTSGVQTVEGWGGDMAADIIYVDYAVGFAAAALAALDGASALL